MELGKNASLYSRLLEHHAKKGERKNCAHREVSFCTKNCWILLCKFCKFTEFIQFVVVLHIVINFLG